MEEVTLWEVQKNVTILTLMDGRRLEVNPGDIPTAILWLPTSSLQVSEDEGGRTYDLSVKNRGNDEHIKARWA